MDTLGPPVAPRPFWTHNAHTAVHLPLTAGRGGVGCMDTHARTHARTHTQTHTDQFSLFLSLLCCFLRFLLLFLQAFLWLGLLLLRRRRRSAAGRGTQHKHQSQLPPSIPPASWEGVVVDRLGKFIPSRHHLQLSSRSYLLIPLLAPHGKE